MRKFLPLHMYLPLIFTCKAKAPPEMGGVVNRIKLYDYRMSIQSFTVSLLKQFSLFR